MRMFINRVVLFSLLLIGILMFSIFLLKDSIANASILGSINDKHEILKAATSPKIILAGGSNVSFGINSELIQKQSGKAVINMGIHAGLGLQFILNDIKPYIKEKDVVIVMPEYENFYTDNFYGEIELVSTIFDVFPEGKKLIDLNQWLRLIKYLPSYSAKKIKNTVIGFFQRNKTKQAIDIYNRYSFNRYGDACLHLDMPNQDFMPAKIAQGNENVSLVVISFLKELKKELEKKKVTLIILPPSIEKQSFNNLQKIINMINLSLKNNDMPFSSEPYLYSYDKSLFFNSYYHLNKEGAEKRSQQLINDITPYIN